MDLLLGFSFEFQLVIGRWIRPPKVWTHLEQLIMDDVKLNGVEDLGQPYPFFVVGKTKDKHTLKRRHTLILYFPSS